MADEHQSEQGQARQTPNCYPVEDIHLPPSRTPTPQKWSQKRDSGKVMLSFLG
jgi:hypothetical protein